jgi:hypothetical protein
MDDCGTVDGMRIFRTKRSTRRKPVPVPLCPPEIPRELTCDRGCRSGKPATNRLSYGTALYMEFTHAAYADSRPDSLVSLSCSSQKASVKKRVSDLDKESPRWHFDRLVPLLQTHSITRNVTEINRFLATVRVCRDAATLPPRRSTFCFH